MTRSKTLFLLLGALLAAPVQAGTAEAYAAYHAKDFATAAREARAAADKGDLRAYVLLGRMYQTGEGVSANPAEGIGWYEKAAAGGLPAAFCSLARVHLNGEGVPRNLEKALAYARRAAQTGYADGQALVFAILTRGPLGYLDASGKPDINKYNALAKREMASRAQDTEARDSLYRSAAQKFPPAQIELMTVLAGTVGEGNNARLRNLALPGGSASQPIIERLQAIIRHMASLGDTLASPQLFANSLIAANVTASANACPGGAGQSPAPRTELVSMAISRPLSGASYLPTSVAGYERAYLVAGSWEERWTFRGCGKTANVRMSFNADGLGGAHYTAGLESVR